MFFSTVVPCHAGEHDHTVQCEHHGEHNHDGPSDDNEHNDEHPCSPFCGYHSSVNSPASSPAIILENIFFEKSKSDLKSSSIVELEKVLKLLEIIFVLSFFIQQYVKSINLM